MHITIGVTRRSVLLAVGGFVLAAALPFGVVRGWALLSPTLYAFLPSSTSWVNVKSYGAKGDGIADDSSAIQTAINALDRGAEIGGGGTVYFPRGVYKITRSLLISGTGSRQRHNFIIQGDGPGASVLRATSGLSNAALLKVDGSAVTRIYNPTIRDIGIDISNAPTARGLEFILAHYINVDHVWILGPAGTGSTEGIRVDGGPLTSAINYSGYNRITRSYIDRHSIGIFLRNQVTATVITDNHLSGSSQPDQVGIRMTRMCAGIEVFRNEIENFTVGIQSSGAGLMAVGNLFESNSVAHVKFEAEAPSGTTLYSMTLGNSNWGAAPMVMTPHDPNGYHDAISTFDVNSEFSIPNKTVNAYAYSANGRDGFTGVKTFPTIDGSCTMHFSGGLMVWTDC
jgi:pectate lyase-like protein